MLSGSLEEITARIVAHTTRTTSQLREQLKSKITTFAPSAAESSAMRTREAKKRIRHDVEAELQKLQTDTCQKAEDARTAVDNLAAKLEQLTTQLN